VARRLKQREAQRSEAGVEGSVAITVAPGRALAAALVAPSADHPLDVILHQQLQHRLGHASQKISLAGLLQQLGQYQSLFGHRVLSRFRSKSCNSTLADWPDGHLNSTAYPHCGLNLKTPPRPWTLTRRSLSPTRHVGRGALNVARDQVFPTRGSTSP